MSELNITQLFRIQSPTHVWRRCPLSPVEANRNIPSRQSNTVITSSPVVLVSVSCRKWSQRRDRFLSWHTETILLWIIGKLLVVWFIKRNNTPKDSTNASKILRARCLLEVFLSPLDHDPFGHRWIRSKLHRHPHDMTFTKPFFIHHERLNNIIKTNIIQH